MKRVNMRKNGGVCMFGWSLGGGDFRQKNCFLAEPAFCEENGDEIWLKMRNGTFTLSLPFTLVYFLFFFSSLNVQFFFLIIFFFNVIRYKNKFIRDATSTTFSQYFYNKL